MISSPLPAGPASRFDFANRVSVRLDTGELSSTTVLQLLGGANSAAIRSAGGAWELIQFSSATLIGPATYELSGLLRGQAGTEGEALLGAAEGARFVLIDAALARLELRPSETGLPINWRYGPAGRNIGDEGFAQQSLVLQIGRAHV